MASARVTADTEAKEFECVELRAVSSEGREKITREKRPERVPLIIITLAKSEVSVFSFLKTQSTVRKPFLK